MLAKFAVSVGLGWASPELLYVLSARGMGKSGSWYLQAVSAAAKSPGGMEDPGWQSQVCHHSQDRVTSAPCRASAVALVGAARAHLLPL